MSRIVWDKTGERKYETGVEQTVLYPLADSGDYPSGVAWNGVTNITESPSGAEPTHLYADNIKYLTLMSAEELGLTIEAYMYPDEFEKCNGSVEVAPGVYAGQQDRSSFGLCYKTIIGNDVKRNSYGYKLHLVYGCLAAPSEKAYASVNDSPEAATMSWEVSTNPVSVKGFKPTACLIIDSTKVDADKLNALEDVLYGTEEAEPKLPLPDAVAEILGGGTSADGEEQVAG